MELVAAARPAKVLATRRARAHRPVLAALALLTALALVPARATAQVDDDDGGGNRVGLAVFLVSDTPLSPLVQATLLRALEGSLKKNDQVDVRDKDLLLAEFGGEVPEAGVDKARGLFSEGAALLDQGDATAAVARLTAAEAAFEPVLAFVKKNELADAQFLLGAAQAAAGDKKKARAVFVRLQVWRPGYQWDVEKYSSLVSLWEGARGDIAKAGRGSLEVMSEPEGAMAFVDGRYVGVTPAAVDGLAIGEHYVTLKLEGYQRRVVKAHVDPRYQELVTETLPRSEKYLLVEQSLARARESLGADAADVAMVELRTFLFLDMAVFVRVSPGKARGTLRLDAYLYDLRSKRRLSEVLGAEVDPAAAPRLEARVRELTGALFASVRYDGQVPAAVSRRKRPDATGPRPFYKKLWFWSAVAASAALIVTPIVFQDELFPEDQPSCAGGQVCTGITTSF